MSHIFPLCTHEGWYVVHSGRLYVVHPGSAVHCTLWKFCTLNIRVVHSEKGYTSYVQERLHVECPGRVVCCTFRKGFTLYIQEGHYVVHSGRDVRCTFRKGCALFIQERMGCSVGRADGREGSGEDGRTVRHLHLAEQPAVYRRVPPRRCHLPGESSASLPSR